MDNDSIQTFLEFTTSSDKTTAELFLKGNGDNLFQAIDQYFIDPNPTRYKNQIARPVPEQRWNEQSFSGDRDGGRASGDNTPSFQLNNDPLTAPSRPPSRNSGAQHHEYVHSQTGPVISSGDAAQVHNAVDFMQPQETGIIAGGGLPAETTSENIVPDVEPNERIRGSQMPAFLKPLPKPDFLPSFITILQSIPQCRQALLSLHTVADDYGHNPDWWRGEAIQRPSIAYNDGKSTNKGQPTNHDLLFELQRILSFLELTNRAYGSAESLARLREITILAYTDLGESPAYVRFMQAWSFAAHRPDMFESRITVDEDEERLTDLWSVAVTWDHLSKDSEIPLANALDTIFWAKTKTGLISASDEFLIEASPIFNVSLPALSKQRIQVPATIYLDRYLLENRSAMQQIHMIDEQDAEKLERLKKHLSKLEDFTYGQRSGKAEDLFKTTLPYLKARSECAETGNDAVREVYQQLEASWARVQARVKSIKKEKAEIEDRVKKLSLALSEPALDVLADLGYKPVHKYNLQGLATLQDDRQITYVKPAAKTVEPEWFRLVYDTSGAKAKIERERVSESDVIEAASCPGNATKLLVYARDYLLSLDHITGLTESLELFVERDNECFRRDLEAAGRDDTIPGSAIETVVESVEERSGDDHNGGLSNCGRASRAASIGSMEVERDRDEELSHPPWGEPRRRKDSPLDEGEIHEMQEVRKDGKVMSLGAMGQWRSEDDVYKGEHDRGNGAGSKSDSDVVMED